jgi:carboxypeptidase Taq
MAGDAGIAEAYAELVRRARELALLNSCSALLGWDEQTYMPPGGVTHRGEQMAHLAGLHHERATDRRIGELLQILTESDLAEDANGDGGRPEAANIREIRRSYERWIRLPRALVEELARTISLAQQEWIAARKDADFAHFRPWLAKIVQLKRDESACLFQSDVNASIYDPLLDEYEPGARSADLKTLFKALREELVPLVQAIGERSQGPAKASISPPDVSILTRYYPRDRQQVFGEMVAAAVGFDFNRGRLDVTAHPFCSGIGPGDTRITTRYDEHEFGDAFFGVLHEVGHGLYEQGLPAEHFGTPLGEAASLGMHESQSRLWENFVGRSRAFWTYWFPLAQRVFHSALSDVSLDRFVLAVNHIAPSLIRVQADELTYNLHIIVRFELEESLLTGDLPVGELPPAWNEKYREALGIAPGNDVEGCLQDIHWSAGLIGYFPTYALGNIYAAQLFARASAELDEWNLAVSRGDCSALLQWLRAQIHCHGQRYRPATLVTRACGAPPDHRALIAALRRKYGEMYGL